MTAPKTIFWENICLWQRVVIKDKGLSYYQIKIIYSHATGWHFNCAHNDHDASKNIEVEAEAPVFAKTWDFCASTTLLVLF